MVVEFLLLITDSTFVSVGCGGAELFLTKTLAGKSEEGDAEKYRKRDRLMEKVLS